MRPKEGSTGNFKGIIEQPKIAKGSNKQPKNWEMEQAAREIVREQEEKLNESVEQRKMERSSENW